MDYGDAWTSTFLSASTCAILDALLKRTVVSLPIPLGRKYLRDKRNPNPRPFPILYILLLKEVHE